MTRRTRFEELRPGFSTDGREPEPENKFATTSKVAGSVATLIVSSLIIVTFADPALPVNPREPSVLIVLGLTVVSGLRAAWDVGSELFRDR